MDKFIVWKKVGDTQQYLKSINCLQIIGVTKK